MRTIEQKEIENRMTAKHAFLELAHPSTHMIRGQA